MEFTEKEKTQIAEDNKHVSTAEIEKDIKGSSR
jgi:hypothetical protein